jgi:hypothetical protein
MQGNGVKVDKEYRYKHASQSVATRYESKVTILWNHQVKYERFIPNNRQLEPPQNYSQNI